MKVCFAATDKFPREWSYINYFTEMAALDKMGVHTLTTDPEAADLILFVDPQLPHRWTLDAIRAHPFVSRYPQKTFIYDERDLTWCALPGIYPSVLASVYDPRRQRAYSYLRNFGAPLSAASLAQAAPPNLLFSFMGADNHKVRRHVLRLTHPRAYIENTSRIKMYSFDGQGSEEEINLRRKLFKDVLRRSKFVLCPRGFGASSFRIYETLHAGRVPVIISDEWAEPCGPDWRQCSLRVRQRDVKKIPALLEAQEEKFEEMSRFALQVYADWFAPDIIFHRTLEKCEELLRLGGSPVLSHPLFDRQFLQCGFDLKRNHILHKLRQLKARALRQGQT